MFPTGILKALFFLVTLCLTKAVGENQAPTLVEVADGFTWAENLAFTGKGELFVSDDFQSKLFRITRNGNGTYTKTVYLDGSGTFSRIAGIVVDHSSDTLYVAAKRVNNTGTIIALNTNSSGPSEYKQVATLPDGLGGNGMRLWKQRLYVTAEGNWLKKDGHVWEVDLTNGGQVKTLVAPGLLNAADGLWITQDGILYVGELFNRNLWRLDLKQNSTQGTIIQGPTAGGWLDDFNYVDATQTFYGCNWVKGRIDVWFLNGTMSPNSPLITGITNPSSARWGLGTDGFPSTSLYITESGGVIPWLQKNRRVWELRNARSL